MENIIKSENLFGISKKVFSIKTLKKYIKEDCITDTTFTKTKEYFLKHFAKSIGETRYQYEPSEDDTDGKIKNITKMEMNEILENFDTNYQYADENGKLGKFGLKNWFNKSYDETFKINSDPRAKKFYKSKKTGQKYINLSKGFLHKNIKSFDSYSEEIKNNVNKVIQHIENVWNSKNKEASEYTLNWLAHSLTVHKMNTALFLRSGEGTGKSILVDFFIKFVIGLELGLSTARAQQLMKFNSQLLGKILVCLEELPTASKSEWFSISDFLKDLITGSSIDIEKKYQDCIQTVNMISLMILTNNDNTIKFGKDARRYFFADISHDKSGDDNYFKDLVSILNKETGEAFFMYLSERYEANKDFNEENVPLTESKIEMKNRNLTTILKHIKTEFLMNRKGLFNNSIKHKMIKLNDLKDTINSEYNIKYSTHAFNIALKSEIPICNIINYGKNKDLFIEPIDHKDLLAFYIKKGFWCDKFDKYETDAEEVIIEDTNEVKILKNEIEALKKQLAEFQKQSVKTEDKQEVVKKEDVKIKVKKSNKETVGPKVIDLMDDDITIDNIDELF